MAIKQPLLGFSLATFTVASALFTLPAASASFDGYNVNLVGSANKQGTDLQLTNDYWQAGAAWVATPLLTDNSFSATFSYSLKAINGGTQADGVALALQNSGSNALGSAGGYIGYVGLSGVGSIIQTWGNNHVGLNTDGNPYNTQSAPGTSLMAWSSLITGTETVAYNALTHALTMNGILNYSGNTYNATDSESVNFASQFGTSIFIGFTGGTGSAESDQRITNFSVTNAVPIPAAIWFVSSVLAGLFGCSRRVTR